MRRWQDVLERINEEIQEMERGLEGRPRLPPLPTPPVDGRDGPGGRNGRDGDALAHERAEADEERAAEMRRRGRDRQRREQVRKQAEAAHVSHWDLRAALSSPQEVRKAIVLREILGPPKALRENDEGLSF